eukprot:gene583-984_t
MSTGEELRDRSLVLPSFSDGELEKAVMEVKAIMGPSADKIDEETLTWYVRMRKLDVDETVPRLTRYQDWRESGYEGIEEEQVATELATGKAFLCDDCDLLGRPVVVVDASKQVVYDRDLEASKQLCVHLMDSALLRMQGTGSETLLSIWDLRGFGTRNADISFLKFFVDCMFKYYPKRIGQVLLVEPPFVFQPVWQVIKPLLGKYSSIVRFVKVSEIEYYMGKQIF